ncbi:MAG: RNA polymerase sigma factor [FCB group bacterium]|nr:RNA polymerase sigma factor [FCB group bacterium]
MESQVVEYIRNAQRGDHLAFERVVSLYDERISRLIISLVGNQKDAEDLYQEIFLKVWKKIGSYKFKSEFYSWLYRLAVNTCLNYLKQIKKHEWEDLESAVSLPIDEPAPFAQGSNLQLMQILRTLPHRQRTVAVMYYLENNKISMISKITRITEGTIKKYLFRTRETIKLELTTDG